MHSHYNKKYFEERDLLDIHLAYTIALLLKEHKLKKVVDVGCGSGQLVSYLHKHKFEAYGCEPNAQALTFARKINPPQRIVQGTATTLPFRSGSFDMVCSISVIEHLTVSEMNSFLKEARRILKKNGLLFLVTPNYAVIWRHIHGKKWFGYSDPTHIYFYTPASLATLLRKHHFGSIQFQFKTLYDPPYSWEMPGFIQKLPYSIKKLITFLLISTPFWRIRNSFWVASRTKK